MRKEFAGPGMPVHLAATGTFLERQSPWQEETTWIDPSLLIEESELVVKSLPVSSTKHLEGALYWLYTNFPENWEGMTVSRLIPWTRRAMYKKEMETL